MSEKKTSEHILRDIHVEGQCQINYQQGEEYARTETKNAGTPKKPDKKKSKPQAAAEQQEKGMEKHPDKAKLKIKNR